MSNVMGFIYFKFNVDFYFTEGEFESLHLHGMLPSSNIEEDKKELSFLTSLYIASLISKDTNALYTFSGFTFQSKFLKYFKVSSARVIEEQDMDYSNFIKLKARD